MSEAPKAPPQPIGHERNSQVLWTRIRKRPAPLISVAYTVPVFLAYQLGVLLLHPREHDAQHHTGFEAVSLWMLRLLDASAPGYVLVSLALALVLLVTTWVHQKRGKIADSPHKRVFWEAVGAAVIGVGVLSYVAHRILQAEATSSPLPVIDRIVMAVGSGFYEEAVFRALGISGGSWVLVKYGRVKKGFLALGVSVVVSAVVFSLAHFFVVGDEGFKSGVAVFRAIEALFFTALYLSRGFAVAVYTHTFYNLLTLLWFV